MNKNFESVDFLKSAVVDGGLRKKNIFKKDKENNPLITVITAVLNNEKYIEECLKSLHSQNYDNYDP